MLKIFIGLLACALISIGVIYLVAPTQVIQSPTDRHATLALRAFLNELGAKQYRSVCWLGDPEKKFARQFFGSSDYPWERLQEVFRTRVWEQVDDCFREDVEAVVVLFPFASTSSVVQHDFNQMQREASEFLSQSGRGSSFVKQHFVFHLEKGARLLVYTRP
jgi:hypothetical protein